MSYIFNKNNIRTEQTLCVIEYKDNLSINVRVHGNLLRPSHFFLYLKQDNIDALKRITNYYIDRSAGLSSWADCPQSKNKRYDYLLGKVVDDFATISATFEDEYIFCWLDWDGDNILMDGGIIDYGSIRQFGLLHHEYKYDDVERYSTSILEQKSKAKYMVQNFIQIVDYLKTGDKKNLGEFSDHAALSEFETIYEQRKKENLLKRLGFSLKKAKQLIKRDHKTIETFQKVFSYFERAKTKEGIVEISDGKTCDAIFNMRNILRDLPQVLIAEQRELTDDEFIEIIASAFATEEDLEMTSYRKAKIKEFQRCYLALVHSCASIFQEEVEDTLLTMSTRSQFINKPNRITGDAVTHIVNLVMNQRKNLSPEGLYQVIQDLAITQNTNPENRTEKILTSHKYKILPEILKIIKENREGI